MQSAEPFIQCRTRLSAYPTISLLLTRYWLVMFLLLPLPSSGKGFDICSAARKRVHISSLSRLYPTCHANVLLSTSGLARHSPSTRRSAHHRWSRTLLTEIQDYPRPMPNGCRSLPLPNRHHRRHCRHRHQCIIADVLWRNTRFVLRATVALADGRHSHWPSRHQKCGGLRLPKSLSARVAHSACSPISPSRSLYHTLQAHAACAYRYLRSGLLHARKLLPLALVTSGLVLCNGHNIVVYLAALTCSPLPPKALPKTRCRADEVRSPPFRCGDSHRIAVPLRYRYLERMLRNAASKGILLIHIGLPAKMFLPTPMLTWPSSMRATSCRYCEWHDLRCRLDLPGRSTKTSA